MGEGRGYTQQRTLAHQQVHLELPSQQTNCNVCRVSSQCSKCTCRLGIEKCHGQFRMEIRCFGFPRDRNTHGTTNSASVFIKTVTNFLDTLHGNQNKVVSRDLRTNRPSDHSDTHMANSALVCITSKNVCTATISYQIHRAKIIL